VISTFPARPEKRLPPSDVALRPALPIFVLSVSSLAKSQQEKERVKNLLRVRRFNPEPALIAKPRGRDGQREVGGDESGNHPRAGRQDFLMTSLAYLVAKSEQTFFLIRSPKSLERFSEIH
jgi:hypothetical protein